MTVAIPVSVGELFDKLTILQIKSQRITDSAKLENIDHERSLLANIAVDTQTAVPLPRLLEFIRLRTELHQVNERLWTIEDAIRDYERQQDFGVEFIELARSVYRTNDRRAQLKRRLDALAGSDITEEKSYAAY